MHLKDSYAGPEARTPRSTLTLPAEKIRDPARIITMLSHIEQDHTLLTVALHGSEQLYNSALLEVSRNPGSLLLDELHPHLGHLQLQAVQRAEIRARYRGVEVSFTSSLIEVGATDGVAHYRMSLPELLHYRQRRADHRVKVGNAHIVPVQLRLEETAVPGQLWDISAGGASIRLTEPLPHTFAQGDIIPHCVITLSPVQTISSALEIRLLRHDESRAQWVLGGRFIGLTPVHRKNIERFVAGLDRELCKKLMKY